MLKSGLPFLAAMLVVTAGTASAQQPRLPPTISQGTGVGTPVPVTSDHGDAAAKRAANEQLQADIQRDSEKMLQLATELNDFVQKNGRSVVSVDAIKKAGEIEKLARGLKTKMKQSF